MRIVSSPATVASLSSCLLWMSAGLGSHGLLFSVHSFFLDVHSIYCHKEAQHFKAT